MQQRRGTQQLASSLPQACPTLPNAVWGGLNAVTTKVGRLPSHSERRPNCEDCALAGRELITPPASVAADAPDRD
eukprot:3596682-Alexandrium_andersonii.AAC.1